MSGIPKDLPFPGGPLSVGWVPGGDSSFPGRGAFCPSGVSRTIFVKHENSGMSTRNVTVVLEDEVALWARVEAARRDTSVSRLLGELLKQQMSREKRYEQAMLSALQREPFLATDGRYLTRHELHERARLR